MYPCKFIIAQQPRLCKGSRVLQQLRFASLRFADKWRTSAAIVSLPHLQLPVHPSYCFPVTKRCDPLGHAVPTNRPNLDPVTVLAVVVVCRPSSHFPRGFSCPVAPLPPIEGFPSFHTSTSVSPTSCSPGLRRSPRLATPPGITGG